MGYDVGQVFQATFVASPRGLAAKDLSGKVLLCREVKEPGQHWVKVTEVRANCYIAVLNPLVIPVVVAKDLADWIAAGEVSLPEGMAFHPTVQNMATLTRGGFTVAEALYQWELPLDSARNAVRNCYALLDKAMKELETNSAAAWRYKVLEARRAFDPTTLPALVAGMNVEIRTVRWQMVFDGPSGHKATATTPMWVIEGVEYPQIHGVTADDATRAGAISVTVNTEFWYNEPCDSVTKEPIR